MHGHGHGMAYDYHASLVWTCKGFVGDGVIGANAAAEVDEGRKEGRKKRTREAAAMAAHQMPTTASGMPHPNAVIPAQYAHAQPQVLEAFATRKMAQKRGNSSFFCRRCCFWRSRGWR
jgi:hypothetical protein